MCSDKLTSIKQVLLDAGRIEITGDSTNIYAAVMMIIREYDNCLQALLIRRSTNDTDVFSGHMAFPGGKKHDHEDRLQAARRETLEEVGIDLIRNSILLGRLDDCNPSTPAARKFIVTPYVSYLTHDTTIEINHEVSEAVWIPINDLNAIYLDNLSKYNNEFRKEAFEYRYADYYIWGLTGRILNNFFNLTNQIL